MPTVGTASWSPAAVTLIAGGGAGMMEALTCHPLDTLKVRMQLANGVKSSLSQTKAAGSINNMIAIQAGVSSLYRGLTAVLSGMVPKMAIRFTSYEWYKNMIIKVQGDSTSGGIFLAGLCAGVTEAVAVVNPMEVAKIRMQAQDQSQPFKYRNGPQTVFTIIKEEGAQALYRGVSLTALRQGTNQAVNFTVYSYLRDLLLKANGNPDGKLPATQTTMIGLVSGAMGPLCNAPIDTIKTRIQKTRATSGQSGWSRLVSVALDTFKNEGPKAFYKGIGPRIMRVAPGQAVTFTVYEYLKKKMEVDTIPATSKKVTTY